MSVSEKNDHSRVEVWKMFDRIAHRYDLLNRMLSMGQDVIWRKKVAKHLPNRDNLHILDVATGTGDLLIFMQQQNKNVKSGIGIDMAEQMLENGRPKLKKRNIADRFSLETGNAVDIPFEANTFDAASISFGIRNVTDVTKGLAEMTRVIKKNGRVIVLEFSLPKNALMRHLYLFYFRKILPFVGGIISGDSFAYRYLNETVETFPYGEDFCKLMSKVGLQNVTMTPLTFGIATIYQGDKL